MKVEREKFKCCKSRVKLRRSTFNNRADMMKFIQFVSPLDCLITNFAVSQDYFFRFWCFQASRWLVQIPVSFHSCTDCFNKIFSLDSLWQEVYLSRRRNTTSCMHTRMWSRDVVRCKDWDSVFRPFWAYFDTPNPTLQAPSPNDCATTIHFFNKVPFGTRMVEA